MFVDLVSDTVGYLGPAGFYFIIMMACTLVLALLNCMDCCKPPSGQGNCFSPGGIMLVVVVVVVVGVDVCYPSGCCECCACCCPCCVEETVGGRDGPSDLLGASAHGVK